MYRGFFYAPSFKLNHSSSPSSHFHLQTFTNILENLFVNIIF